MSAFARRTRTAKAPTAQRTALFIAPSLSSDTSDPGAHADASGKTPTLLPICPRPRSACGCVGQALQPYCRHASAPGARADASGKLSNLIADMPRPRSACGCVGQALQPYCRHAPDPGAHADAPPKAPFPTTFRQPPPAARPDENFRQDSPPGQESRAALPVPSKQTPPSCKRGLSHAGERPFDGKAPTHAGVATVSKRCELPFQPRPNAPPSCKHGPSRAGERPFVGKAPRMRAERDDCAAGAGLPDPPNSTHPAPVQAGPVSHQRASIRQQSPHACRQSRDDRAAGAGLPTLPQKQLDLSRPIKTKHPALPATPSCKHGLSHARERPFVSKAPTHAGMAAKSAWREMVFLPRPETTSALLIPPKRNRPRPSERGPFARRRAVI